ncbi:MAG TPA: methylated-DNA--[protein]-cysteine S-methyltransferase [Pseudonocardia sp.]|jgi:methylated-DNA-[protein]-cysteine S-methyltransferase|nr:methylated-DNA--[protein]-cysteine S-methyltransferase [Pseudonocardia sp.]
MSTTIRSTPVGPLTLTASDEGITRVAFGAAPADTAPSTEAGQWLEQACRELDEYFAGTRTAFTVPVDLRGVGAGQRAALDLLGAVSHGETTTYGRLAAQLARRGGPASESWSSHVGPRRVGSAMARNPVPVLVPCHRVVGSNGDLTGYAGGLEIKRRLLELESPQGMLGSA